MSTQTIEIAFPKVDEGSTALAIPEAHNLPVATGLSSVAAKPETRRTLNCSYLLQGQTRAEAEAEAAKLLEEMLDNTQVFMTYGMSALEGVNALVDRILNELEPVRIPELEGLMKDLNDEMRSVRGKYDMSDPKVRERYEKWSSGVKRFFRNAKTMIDMFREDISSVQKQLEKISGQLRGQQYTLLRNVAFYDELYDENEAEIVKLIYVIGVMELIRDLAVEQAKAIDVGDSTLGDRGSEQQAKVVQLAHNMDIKIAEYKGRLFVAWATSPQVRMMRELNVGLAMRINELICVTVPTMKLTAAQWQLMIQTQDAAKLAQAVADASNEWLQAYARAGAEAVPMIAQTIETPTLTPETIAAMADSIATQANGIVQAMKEGTQRRADMQHAMMMAKKVLDDSSQLITDTVINSVVATATRPLELEVSTSVK